MKIIVGLGNPEKKYDNTYHNMGFSVIDTISEKLNVKLKKLECKARTYTGKDFVLAKPQTYMNLSGESVQGLIKKYNADFQDLFVIYDDIDIEIGQIRIRKSGSAGTHNGMRSIINCINTQDFPRLRVGIGRNDTGELKDYVLSQISRNLYDVFFRAVKDSADAAIEFISGGSIDSIMAKYNR